MKKASIIFLLVFVCNFVAFAQEAMHIDPTGNVGIGTATPKAKLDVNGTINTSGALTVGGNATVTGNFTAAGWARFIYSSNFTPPNNGGLYIGWNKSGGNGETNFISTTGPNGAKAGYTFDIINNQNARTELMTIRESGLVGIGITNPRYPLDIDGYIIIVDNNGTVPFGPSSIEAPSNAIGMQDRWGNGFHNKPISIHSTYGILAGYGVYTSSDQRIKKNFIRATTYNDLALLNLLQVTSFQYKNSFAYGNGFSNGFIAQEVEKIYPQAVNTSTDFIPDIFLPAESIHIDNTLLTVTLAQAHHLTTGDMVRLITKTGQNKEVPITVTNEMEFTVADWTDKSDKLFVYGKRVTDFKSVDYQQIFSLGVSAVQELSKQVDQLKKENEALRTDNTEMKAGIDDFKKKDTALLDAIAAIQTRLQAIENKQVSGVKLAKN